MSHVALVTGASRGLGFAMAEAFENGDAWLKGTMMTLADSRIPFQRR